MEQSYLRRRKTLGRYIHQRRRPVGSTYRLTVSPLFNLLFNIFSYVFQEERGQEGTPHLQGIVHYRQQVAFSTIKQISIRIHWERCIDIRASVEYCSNPEKRSGLIWISGFSLPQVQVQVLRPDQLKDWQIDIIDTLRGPADDRTVNWIVDIQGGQGKTALCKFIIANFTEVLFLSTSSAKDAAYQIIKTPQNFKIILFNLPRQAEGHLSYAAFESLKDGLVYSGKYTGGFKLFPPPHVYIFANWNPDRTQLSMDRWNIIEI